MSGLERITSPTAAVLRVLLAATEPTWGLQVIKATGTVAGTVYPILERLEAAGVLTSQWEDDPSRPGPRRRFYTLTDEGSGRAEEALERYNRRHSAAPHPRAAGAHA